MTLDDELAQAVRRDWRSAPLSARERALLAYVERLTLRPATCSAADLQALREAGFDETAIVQATLIASFFNYVNRVADGLGVGRAGSAP